MKRHDTPYSEVDLLGMLKRVAAGSLSIDRAADALRALPVEELGFASLDHHRALRKGFPEVVFCQSKTPAQVSEIFARLAKTGQAVLGTRATPDHYKAARRRNRKVKYDPLGRALWIEAPRRAPRTPGVVLVSAGTADLPIAEEAARTLEVLGHEPERIYDVGVAGLHRLVRHTRTIQHANVVIVVAGMEGALASVIGGLTSAPVVAVPTSVGYGTSLGGFTALFAMLNSCSPGISVVNIDNGFGAGYLAASINRRIVGGPAGKAARS
jgi:pyridinium-3,5-biscarboxylic acid mononucleotide synthase